MIPVQLLVFFLLVLPFAAILFVIAGAVEEKLKRKRDERQRAEMEQVLDENRKTVSVRAAKPSLRTIVRGYDSSELFLEDSLIRFANLKRRLPQKLKAKTSAMRCAQKTEHRLIGSKK